MGTFFSKSSETNIPANLAGKVVVVTGANTGIGYETVKALALRGAKVYLGSRDESRGTGALARLESKGVPKDAVELLKLDLSRPALAKAAAEELLRRTNRLDLLINNAAILLRDYGLTEDGVTTLMSTNHIGPFVFTTTLLPLLIKTSQEPGSDVRIVNLSSGVHKIVTGDIKVDSLTAFNDKHENASIPHFAHYGYTKLCTILFTKELQRRLDASNTRIVITAVNPGGVATGGALSAMSEMPLGWIVAKGLKLFAKAPAEGIYNTLYAATASSPETIKGAYLEPVGKVSNPSKAAQSDKLARELWETTEKVVSDILGKNENPWLRTIAL